MSIAWCAEAWFAWAFGDTANASRKPMIYLHSRLLQVKQLVLVLLQNGNIMQTSTHHTAEVGYGLRI